MSVIVNSQHARTGLRYVKPLPRTEASQFHSFQMELAELAHSDNRVREKYRQRDFAQLYDLMFRLLEEVQADSRRMPLAVQQLTEPHTLKVGLT
jgi:hypothetical protein